MNEKTGQKPFGLHETLQDRSEVRLGSERSFGIVFAVVFLIVALLPLLASGTLHTWSLGVAVTFLALAFLAPKALAPLNRLWFRFGLLLHRIINPLIMGLLFFVVVTPTGWLMRTFGKDLLRLRFDPSARSYWIERQPPDAETSSLRNQF